MSLRDESVRVLPQNSCCRIPATHSCAVKSVVGFSLPDVDDKAAIGTEWGTFGTEVEDKVGTVAVGTVGIEVKDKIGIEAEDKVGVED